MTVKQLICGISRITVTRGSNQSCVAVAGGGREHRVTSVRKRCPLGTYRRPVSGVPGGSQGGGRFLMGELPLYREWLGVAGY